MTVIPCNSAFFSVDWGLG